MRSQSALLLLVSGLLATACAASNVPAQAPAATSPPVPNSARAEPAAATSSAPLPSANATVASAPAAAAARERQSLKYGYNPILPGAPEFIAQERGYFAEQ